MEGLGDGLGLLGARQRQGRVERVALAEHGLKPRLQGVGGLGFRV